MLGAGLATLIGIAGLSSLQPTAPVVSALAPASPAPTTRLSSAPTSTPTPTPRPTLTPEPTFGPIGQTTEARVVRVTDGDTIVVNMDGQEFRVRYIGMDTPETVDPSSPVQWMGPQATAANAALVQDRSVFLERDASEVDSFGRLLRHVWVTDGSAWILVNMELVRQGVAIAKSYPPDTKYDALYDSVQADARVAALGLWGPTPAPPTPAPTALPTIVAFVNPNPKPAAKCHPSYDPCLPIVDDLDCKDIRAMGADPVSVVGPDTYRLDSDGDGVGCE
jgi:micrococcal nuclease